MLYIVLCCSCCVFVCDLFLFLHGMSWEGNEGMFV